MQRLLCLLLLVLHVPVVFAQTTTIRGRLLSKDKEPVIGANISLRDTYDGATSDTAGRFQFDTEESGAQILQVTALGYDSIVQKVTLQGSVSSSTQS